MPVVSETKIVDLSMRAHQMVDRMEKDMDCELFYLVSQEMVRRLFSKVKMIVGGVGGWKK